MPLSLQTLPREYVDFIDSAAEQGLSEDEICVWRQIVTSFPIDGLSQIKNLLDTVGNSATLLRSFIHEFSLLETGNETDVEKLIDEQLALLQA